MSHIGIALAEINGAVQDVYLDATNNLAVVHDAEAVGQHGKQRLKTFKGEWFLNVDQGVPWIDEIFGRQYDPALSESIVKSVLRKTDGIVEITAFSVRFESSARNLLTDGIIVKTIYDQEVEL